MVIPAGKNILITPNITTSVGNTLPISDYPVWVFWVFGAMLLILSASVIYLIYVMYKEL